MYVQQKLRKVAGKSMWKFFNMTYTSIREQKSFRINLPCNYFMILFQFYDDIRISFSKKGPWTTISHLSYFRYGHLSIDVVLTIRYFGLKGIYLKPEEIKTD